MIGPNLVVDDIDIDGGSFFDHIDDLLDFPEDNENELPGKNGDSFPSIWTAHPDAFPGSDLLFSANNNSNCTSDLSTELSVPYEDIVQLEWLSNFVEDSFSGGSLTFSKEECHDNNKQSSSQNQFRTSSPVSVLESSSSCSGEKPAIVTFAPKISARGRCGRARSKRPRPATFIPRHAIQLISPASSITETSRLLSPSKTSSESENFAESHPIVKRKKKMKMSPPLSRLEGDQNHPPPAAHTVRKCMHCEITKTPQWRAGPMGPKTLCNACGVRYKSGRLFPEYRPAASPTFLPSVHSNSHKKVLEMRKQEGGNAAPTLGIVATHEGQTKSIIVSPPELIPNNNPLLGYI